MKDDSAATVATIHTVTKDWIAAQIKSFTIKAVVVSVSLVAVVVVIGGSWTADAIVTLLGKRHDAFVKSQDVAFAEFQKVNQSAFTAFERDLLNNVAQLSNQVTQLSNQLKDIQSRLPKQRAELSQDEGIIMAAASTFAR